MTQTKQNKKGWGCFILPLIIVGAGALGFYYGKNKLLGEKLTPMKALEIVPPSAPVTAFISTNSQNWQKLSQFQIMTTREDWLSLPPEIDQENNGINYQEEIEPWLGGMMIAVLPVGEMGLDYESVFIGGIKNKLKAKSFFDKFRKEDSNQLRETKHLDVTLYEVISADNTPYWLTFFDSYLIVGESESTVKQVVNTYSTKNSLAKQKTLSPEITKKLQISNPLLQFHLMDYEGLLLNIAKNSVDFDENTIPDTPINSAITSLNIEDHGLNFRTIVDLSQPFNDVPFSSNQLLSEIPQDAIFAVEGAGLNQLWQEVENNQETIPELSEGISQIKSLLQGWLNLDLNNDIFGWLDGEFVFSLSLDQNNSFADSGLRGKLILGTSDKTTAENTINRMENLASNLFNISQTDVGGINVTRLQSYREDVMSYGWQNNQLLVFNISPDLSLINTPNRGNSLQDDSTFKLTTATLPKKNTGYLYFDMEKALNFAQNVEPTIFDDLDPDVEKLLQSVKAIALTSTMINPSTNQIDLNISLPEK